MAFKKYVFIGFLLCFLSFSTIAMPSEKNRLYLKAFNNLFDRNASFVGSQSCFPCHLEEFRQWEKTPHSKAFITLTSRGKEEDSKCLVCHSLGYGFESGFKNLDETPMLTNVQCESCHGPGSLHINEKFEIIEWETGKSERVCLECHDLGSSEKHGRKCDECHTDFAKHLNTIQKKKSILRNPEKEICTECHDERNDRDFNFSTGYRAILHMPVVVKIEEDLHREKANVVLLQSAPKLKVSSYVGNEACKDCHKKEYNSWTTTKHAKSFETLKKTNEQKTVRCLRCHTTGYGKASGFLDEQITPNLRGVGCESCHGPGKDHIGASPDKKISSLTGITKDCFTCSIPRTCKRCHTIREDPDFNIDRDLELVKHLKSGQ